MDGRGRHLIKNEVTAACCKFRSAPNYSMPAVRSDATLCTQDEEPGPTTLAKQRSRQSSESGTALVVRDSDVSMEGGCSDGEGEESLPNPVKRMGRMSRNGSHRLAEFKDDGEDASPESQESHGEVRAGRAFTRRHEGKLVMGVAFTCTAGLALLLTGARIALDKAEDDTGLLAASVRQSTDVGQRLMPPPSQLPSPLPMSPPASSMGEQAQPRPSMPLRMPAPPLPPSPFPPHSSLLPPSSPLPPPSPSSLYPTSPPPQQQQSPASPLRPPSPPSPLPSPPPPPAPAPPPIAPPPTSPDLDDYWNKMPAKTPVEMFASAFSTTGILIHTTTCHGFYCNGWTQTNAGEWLQATLGSDQLVPELERDCGEWCMASSYQNPQLPFTPFSFPAYQSGVALVYAATDEVWEQVQCLSVTDSSSSTRACCACADPNLCPFRHFEQADSGYCGAPCGDHDNTCKQLAAGCGASVWDIAGRSNEGGRVALGLRSWDEWGDQECSQEEISQGDCDLCKRPLWCESYRDDWNISTPQQWMDAFWQRDAGNALGARQCKWKPSQRDMFIATSRLRHTERLKLPLEWGYTDGTHFDYANTWNEVSIYAHPGDNRQKRLMFRNLIGILYLRTSGNDADLRNVRALHQHWKQLGQDVPMFAVSAEPMDEVDSWRPNHNVDLRDAPYNLEQIFE